MEIQINQNNASEFLIETNKLRWKLYVRKVIIAILLMFFWGFLFFISGLRQGYDSSTSDYKQSKNYTITYVHSVQNNYHIFFGLGIAFMLFSLYLFYTYLIRQRNFFFKVVYKIVDRHKNTSGIYTLKINDEGVYYHDFEITREEKWSVFLTYKIHKEYLLLFRDELYINCLIIDKRQISHSDLADLLGFLRNKLIEKK